MIYLEDKTDNESEGHSALVSLLLGVKATYAFIAPGRFEIRTYFYTTVWDTNKIANIKTKIPKLRSYLLHASYFITRLGKSPTMTGKNVLETFYMLLQDEDTSFVPSSGILFVLRTHDKTSSGNQHFLISVRRCVGPSGFKSLSAKKNGNGSISLTSGECEALHSR